MKLHTVDTHSPVPVTPRYDGLVDCVQRIGWLPSRFIHAARFGGPQSLTEWACD